MNVQSELKCDYAAHIEMEMTRLQIPVEEIYIHGSRANNTYRENSDLDVLVFSKSTVGHRKIVISPSEMPILDINVFDPVLFRRLMFLQRKRGTRFLASMLHLGYPLVGNPAFHQLLQEAGGVYSSAPPDFPVIIFRSKVEHLLQKIESNSNNPVIAPLISALMEAIGISYLWLNGQWSSSGHYLLKILWEYDKEFFEILVMAYKEDTQCMQARRLAEIAREVFSDVKADGPYVYEDSYL